MAKWLLVGHCLFVGAWSASEAQLKFVPVPLDKQRELTHSAVIALPKAASSSLVPISNTSIKVSPQDVIGSGPNGRRFVVAAHDTHDPGRLHVAASYNQPHHRGNRVNQLQQTQFESTQSSSLPSYGGNQQRHQQQGYGSGPVISTAVSTGSQEHSRNFRGPPGYFNPPRVEVGLHGTHFGGPGYKHPQHLGLSPARGSHRVEVRVDDFRRDGAPGQSFPHDRQDSGSYGPRHEGSYPRFEGTTSSRHEGAFGTRHEGSFGTRHEGGSFPRHGQDGPYPRHGSEGPHGRLGQDGPFTTRGHEGSFSKHGGSLSKHGGSYPRPDLPHPRAAEGAFSRSDALDYPRYEGSYGSPRHDSFSRQDGLQGGFSHQPRPFGDGGLDSDERGGQWQDRLVPPSGIRDEGGFGDRRDVAQQRPDVTAERTSCGPQSPCIEPNGLFPVDGNCCGFVNCANCRPYTQRCAAGTVFDLDLWTCNHERDTRQCAGTNRECAHADVNLHLPQGGEDYDGRGDGGGGGPPGAGGPGEGWEYASASEKKEVKRKSGKVPRVQKKVGKKKKAAAAAAAAAAKAAAA